MSRAASRKRWRELELEHVVITSVNRDELPDGGAAIFAETIRLLPRRAAAMTIEVLIPDFKGDEDALRLVVEARPRHPRITTSRRSSGCTRGRGRAGATGAASRIWARPSAWIPTCSRRSGVILGMGETQDEIRQAMSDLRKAGVDILTLGQYLRPIGASRAGRALGDARRSSRSGSASASRSSASATSSPARSCARATTRRSRRATVQAGGVGIRS